MKRLLEYWRNSLADAGRLSPSRDDLKLALETESLFDLADFVAGQLPAGLTKRLFDVWEEQTRHVNEDDEEVWRITVTLYPIVFAARHLHGERQDPHGQPLCVPLCVSAKVGRDGQLAPDDPEHKPLLIRDLLEPARSAEVIGTLDEADRFYADNPAPLVDWSQTVEFAQSLLEAVNGQSLESMQLHPLRRLPYGLVIVSHRATYSRAILEAYDRLLELNTWPPLLKRLAEGAPDEGLIDSAHQSSLSRAHVGQMTCEYGLAESQREALAHFLNTLRRPNEVLAINGPPGTGKTTLLQSVVATLWVQAALDDAACPIIVAASSNNQAVTNVIDSFADTSQRPDDALSGRWIDGLKSYGVFMPSSSADEGDRQLYRWVDDHFALDLERPETLAHNTSVFLDHFGSAFPDQPAEDLGAAQKILHEELKSTVDDLDRLIAAVQSLAEHTPAGPLSLPACRNRQRELEHFCQQGAEAHDTCAQSLAALRTLATDWAAHQASEPVWLTLLAFLKAVRRRGALRNKAFILQRRQQHGFDWLEENADPPTIDEHIRAAVSAAEAAVKHADAERQEAGAKLRHYQDHLEPYASWCKAHSIDGTPDQIWITADTTHRYRAFQLATHYWEAAYLLEVEQQLSDHTRDRRSPEKLIAQYRRLAKLAPCFVSTVFMLPKHFTAWVGEAEPLLGAIDLLIVDEAGQTAPDIAAASFAFAERALVVGDTQQIEPIWQIPERLDRANARKFQLDDDGYERFFESGLSAAHGSVMTVAQRASRHTKFPAIARGMFLREHRRCVDDIIAYCNELAYQGQLKPYRGSVEQPWLLPPMGFASIEAEDRKVGGSRDNRVEARVIATWIGERRSQLEGHYGKGIDELLGIVTPFAAQVRTLASCLREQNLPVKERRRPGITVGTVHALQGAERAIVIFSPVYGRRHRGSTFFGRDHKMLNVAVSRAMDSFLVFGNMNLFGRSAVGHSARLLGRHVLRSENEITDIEPVLLVGSAKSRHDELITTLEGHRQVVRDVLQGAQREVGIVSPFLREGAIAADQIDQQIAEATARGVSVSVFTDDTINGSPPDFARCLGMLKRAGAKILLADRSGIHSKMLWRDRDLFAVGSFNWLSAPRDEGNPYRRYEASALCRRRQTAEPMIRRISQELGSICRPSTM